MGNNLGALVLVLVAHEAKVSANDLWIVKGNPESSSRSPILNYRCYCLKMSWSLVCVFISLIRVLWGGICVAAKLHGRESRNKPRGKGEELCSNIFFSFFCCPVTNSQTFRASLTIFSLVHLHASGDRPGGSTEPQTMTTQSDSS